MCAHQHFIGLYMIFNWYCLLWCALGLVVMWIKLDCTAVWLWLLLWLVWWICLGISWSGCQLRPILRLPAYVKFLTLYHHFSWWACVAIYDRTDPPPWAENVFLKMDWYLALIASQAIRSLLIWRSVKKSSMDYLAYWYVNSFSIRCGIVLNYYM